METRHTRRSALGLLGGVIGTISAAPAGAAEEAADGRGGAGHGPVPEDLRPGGAYDRYVADLAQRDAFSGTILVTHRDRPVLSRSYGMADKRRSIPNRPDTAFAVGSITKCFTGLAITRLAERGDLEFHQELGAFVDGFPAGIADTVTVHHLLLHTAGFGNYLATDAWREGKAEWNSAEELMAETTRIIRETETRLPFPPGSDGKYSNSGYHLLGEVVAKAAGRPYHDYVREHVFRAAGMTGADFHTKSEWRENPLIAHPYALDSAGRRVDVLDDNPVIGLPAGNSHATAADLARFVTALRDHDLLKPAYTDVYLAAKRPGRWSDSRLMPPQVKFNTYGPHALLVNDRWGLGHNGGAPGIGAYLEWYPANDVVSVVLGNYDVQTVSDVAATARKIAMGGW